MNKVVQAGANNQFGGVNVGLFRVLYHVFTELKVEKDPITPANWHTSIDVINLKYFFIWLLI